MRRIARHTGHTFNERTLPTNRARRALIGLAQIGGGTAAVTVSLHAAKKAPEATEEFEVSASMAIIYVKCFRETGRCATKPRGGRDHLDRVDGIMASSLPVRWS